MDFEKANAELDLALEKRPNDPFLISLSASSFRRSGDFERAGTLWVRSSDLDPTNYLNALMAASMQPLLRHYDQAERYLDRWIANVRGTFSSAREDPETWWDYYLLKAELVLASDGNVDSARVLLQRGEKLSGVDYWDIITGMKWPRERVMCVYEIEACREGLRNTTPPKSQQAQLSRYIRMADLYHWVGEAELSRAYYDSAAITTAHERDSILANPVPWVQQMAYHQYPLQMARISAGLNDTAATLQFIEQSMEAFPTMVDRLTAVGAEGGVSTAESYLLVGEIDAALERLEYWLSRPSRLSVALLRVDPIWDPIRDDPRFLALLERYGRN